ncbi:cyclophilin-like fold protein [Kribbella sp. NPDC049584]|uniref:cyclophilin-like fold protein n=1 Tax=Kribbella sp. NPDC049584 TaxID=3154833 RepID=UPI00342751A5
MRLQITIGDQHFQATLEGPLPAPLSLDGQPAGVDPDVGDVGYYAPGNDFVLYYGDQSYYDGIVVLGRMDGDAAERIARMDGSIKVLLRP